jgi:hypothetical protein
MLDGQVSDAVEARSGIDTLLPSYSGVNTLLIFFSPPIQGWILSLFSSPLLFRVNILLILFSSPIQGWILSSYTLLTSCSGLNTLLILFSPPVQGWILSLYSSPPPVQGWILSLYSSSLLFRGEYSPYTLLSSYARVNILLIFFSSPIQGWILSLPCGLQTVRGCSVYC